MTDPQREGVVVRPYRRLSEKQIQHVDGVSRWILDTQGIHCYNDRAGRLFRERGARVEARDDHWHVRIPAGLVDQALESAPSTVVLGARDPANRLVLDAHEPRVRFGSGSETNIWLDVAFGDDGTPAFTRREGSVARLRAAAHLCDNLEHLDFFIRCVNIQDPDVTPENKDVNKFLASLDNITKHVQAGLTDVGQLDNVIRLGECVAGGPDAFAANPVLSFICCAVKSPLQIVDDTAETFMEIAKRKAPVVISSCPMGGATGPFDEFGMVALINAELLAGVILNQLVSPGAPILYGAVPVRTRLDNLNDMYGAPEFNHYNIDCAQMARFYGLPCYSTAGVADASVPGIQATVEKLITLASVPRGGAQYIHYAFGLLERTNVFCPEQAVMDDAHIGIVKHMLAEPDFGENEMDGVKAMLDEVMQSDHKTFIYHLPLPTRDKVYVRYPLEADGGALRAAYERRREIMARPRRPLPDEIRDAIRKSIPGVLDKTLP
ncbi:MAG: trimethylamine methyltransferase family protein [Lentisphaerae bacterium]|nr:trimethylamine methyltransferase family protein [Lentisphaerota bacterium]